MFNIFSQKILGTITRNFQRRSVRMCYCPVKEPCVDGRGVEILLIRDYRPSLKKIESPLDLCFSILLIFDSYSDVLGTNIENVGPRYSFRSEERRKRFTLQKSLLLFVQKNFLENKSICLVQVKSVESEKLN